MVVQNAIATAGLQSHITQSAQDGSQVKLLFKACPLDALFGAVSQLSRQGIKVVSMNTTRGTKLGTADGSIIFSVAN